MQQLEQVPEAVDGAAQHAAIATLERYAAAGAISCQDLPAIAPHPRRRQWYVDRGQGAAAWMIAVQAGERFAWAKGGYDTLRRAVQAYNATNRQAAAL